MTAYAVPSSRPKSWIARMFGCESAATAFASRSKRASASSSSARRRGEDLDRHLAVEPRVARAVDLAHAAGTEGRDDLVGSEALAGGEAHLRGGSWTLCWEAAGDSTASPAPRVAPGPLAARRSRDALQARLQPVEGRLRAPLDVGDALLRVQVGDLPLQVGDPRVGADVLDLSAPARRSRALPSPRRRAAPPRPRRASARSWPLESSACSLRISARCVAIWASIRSFSAAVACRAVRLEAADRALVAADLALQAALLALDRADVALQAADPPLDRADLPLQAARPRPGSSRSPPAGCRPGPGSSRSHGRTPPPRARRRATPGPRRRRRSRPRRATTRTGALRRPG